MTNYRMGQDGHMYFVFEEFRGAVATPGGVSNRLTVCEIVPRPFSLVGCVEQGYSGMGQLDTDNDNVYDSTLYLSREPDSMGSGAYLVAPNKTVRSRGSDFPAGRYVGMDIISPTDVRLYTRWWPVTGTGAYYPRLGIFKINPFTSTGVNMDAQYLGQSEYCNTDDPTPCGYTSTGFYQQASTVASGDSWPYYYNQWVDLFSATELPTDPFGNPSGGRGNYSGSLTFDTEDQVCAPQYFSGATITQYSYSGSLLADFSGSAVNGVYGFSGAGTSYLYYGTGSELEPGWSQSHAVLGIASDAAYYGEFGILGAGTFRSLGSTNFVYAAGTGAFLPNAFRIDNTALPSGTCGDLAIQYSYYNQSGTAIFGTGTVLASGSGTYALPGIRDRFVLALSSLSGNVCIDDLEIVSGPLVPEEIYQGDITKYACETQNYSCSWSTIDSCGPANSCSPVGDYCSVNPDLLESTSSGSFTFNYNSILDGDYTVVDFDGSATGGLSYSSGTGSYGALVPSSRSSITGTGCLLFSTGSGAPRFLYTYSNGATMGYDVMGLSDSSMVREFLSYFQKIVDLVMTPVNDVLSVATSVGPVPDNSYVCLFGSPYYIDYQSAFFMTGAVAIPGIEHFEPVPGEWTIFDYVFLFIAVLGLTSPTYHVLKSLKPSE